MKTLELYKDEPLILLVKEKKYNHNYTSKGHDLLIETFLVYFCPEKGLSYRRLDTCVPQEVKK